MEEVKACVPDGVGPDLVEEGHGCLRGVVVPPERDEKWALGLKIGLGVKPAPPQYFRAFPRGFEPSVAHHRPVMRSIIY
jgi:hypothetical protein